MLGKLNKTVLASSPRCSVQFIAPRLRGMYIDIRLLITFSQVDDNWMAYRESLDIPIIEAVDYVWAVTHSEGQVSVANRTATQKPILHQRLMKL